MMKRIFTYCFLVSLLTFSACDVVEDPIIVVGSQYQSWVYGPAPTFGAATADMIYQRVLIEDFTGHDCGNCPSAAALAEELKAANPEKVIVIGVHAGSLAQPLPPEFPADWTTETGELWFAELDFPYNPVGRVNRAPGLATSLFESEWGDAVDAQLGLDPDAVVQMQAEYIPDANHLNIHVYTEMMSDVDGQVKMLVVITEDGLEGPQLNYDLVDDPDTPQNEQIVEEYEFEHMLRGTVNGSYGVIVGTDVVAGETDLKSYTFDWNPAWDAQHSNVIAIVFEESTGRILNSVEVHLDA